MFNSNIDFELDENIFTEFLPNSNLQDITCSDLNPNKENVFKRGTNKNISSLTERFPLHKQSDPFKKPQLPEKTRNLLSKISAGRSISVQNRCVNEQGAVNTHNTEVYNGSGAFEKRVVQRKFPGPAGLLPERRDLDIDISKLEESFRDGGETRNEIDNELLCSQTSSSTFNKDPWLKMCRDFETPTPGGSLLPDQYNIEWIKRQASFKSFVNNKVPFLAAVIKSVERLTPKTPTLILKDPTGEIQAAVPQDLYEKHINELRVGSVLVLRHCSVLSTNNDTKHYLIVTSNNLRAVYDESNTINNFANHSRAGSEEIYAISNASGTRVDPYQNAISEQNSKCFKNIPSCSHSIRGNAEHVMMDQSTKLLSNLNCIRAGSKTTTFKRGSDIQCRPSNLAYTNNSAGTSSATTDDLCQNTRSNSRQTKTNLRQFQTVNKDTLTNYSTPYRCSGATSLASQFTVNGDSQSIFNDNDTDFDDLVLSLDCVSDTFLPTGNASNTFHREKQLLENYSRNNRNANILQLNTDRQCAADDLGSNMAQAGSNPQLSGSDYDSFKLKNCKALDMVAKSIENESEQVNVTSKRQTVINLPGMDDKAPPSKKTKTLLEKFRFQPKIVTDDLPKQTKIETNTNNQVVTQESVCLSHMATNVGSQEKCNNLKDSDLGKNHNISNFIDCSQISIISQNVENPEVLQDAFHNLDADSLFEDF